MQTRHIIYKSELNGNFSGSKDSLASKVEKKFEEHSQIDKRRLDAIVSENREIYRIYSVFPFDLFPDMLVIDENKITFIIKDFWKVERVHSIYVKDISDCIVQTSIIFSSLNVIDLGFRENWISIGFLKNGEALKARRIIQGLMLVHKLGLDLSGFNINELAPQVEALGRARDTGTIT